MLNERKARNFFMTIGIALMRLVIRLSSNQEDGNPLLHPPIYAASCAKRSFLHPFARREKQQRHQICPAPSASTSGVCAKVRFLNRSPGCRTDPRGPSRDGWSGGDKRAVTLTPPRCAAGATANASLRRRSRCVERMRRYP